MKRLRNQAGSNLVEFALVLPLLLVLVFGIIDFSLALFDKAVITNAAREGARAGMVFRDPRMSEADIRTVVQNYAAAHLVSFGTSALAIDVAWAAGEDGINDQSSGDTLTVQVAYPYDYLVMDNLVPALGSLNLRATSVMRYE